MAKARWWNPLTWFNAIVTADSWTWATDWGRQTKSGEKVNEQTALQTSVVWACISALSETAGALPLKAYEESDGVRKVAYGDGHDLRRVKRPSLFISMQDFVRFVITNLCLSGNAFAIIARNTAGEPIQIIPTLPSAVQILFDEDRRITYEVTLQDGTLTLVSFENMLHFKMFSMDGIVGLSPVSYLAETLGLAAATRDWASAFMKSGGWSGGYIIYDEFLNETQKAAVQANVPDIRRGGAKDLAKMGILQGGPKVQTLGINPKDSQFIESRQFSDEEIAGAYKVPLWVINRMRSGSYVGTGLEQQVIAFLMFGMNPYLVSFETEFNYKIFGDKDGAKWVEFTRQALMQMDSKARADFFKAALGGSGSSGYMSVNEVRVKENLPKLDGDEYDRVSVWQFGNDKTGVTGNGN